MLAETLQIGNTKIEIYDDYVVKTNEEVNGILKEIAKKAYPHLKKKEQDAKEKYQHAERTA